MWLIPHGIGFFEEFSPKKNDQIDLKLQKQMKEYAVQLKEPKAIMTIIKELLKLDEMIIEAREKYKQLISWADVFSGASIEIQKIIASYICGYEFFVEP